MNVKHPTRASDLVFLGIGDAGCYGQGKSTWGSFRTSIPDNRLECYYWMMMDGAIVMDKRPAFKRDDAASVREVIAGPMLDPFLPVGSIHPLMGVVTLASAYPAAPGSLDHIALDIYCERWRALGARIGKRVGDEIAWEDGEREPVTIPAWELARYA